MLPANNRIEAGAWWDEPSGRAGRVARRGVRRVGRHQGRRRHLDFDIGGLPVEARVTSIRRVEWDSMAPNFFILFSPGALRDVPATYMTSFYLRAGGQSRS